MRIKRVCIDIDNVIRNFSQYSIDKWNKQFPNKPKLELNMWGDPGWCYSLFSGETKKIKRDKCFQWWIDQGIYENAPPVSHAKKALDILSQLGFEIVIVSHQTREAHPDAALITTTWLYKNEIYFDELHYVSDKSVVSGDILIDDNPEIIRNFLIRGVSEPHYGILFDYPWNNDNTYDFEKMAKDKIVFRVFQTDGFWKSAITTIKSINQGELSCHQPLP